MLTAFILVDTSTKSKFVPIVQSKEVFASYEVQDVKEKDGMLPRDHGLEVKIEYVHSEAVVSRGHETAIDIGLNEHSQSTIIDTIQFYTVQNSPLEQINGRYKEDGKFCGISKFRNVRGWCILCYTMSEIPELGILASNAYKMQEGSTLAEYFHRTAGKILSNTAFR